uniref:Uncharacterized protein n=1 Tax=Parascaris equorum TaxID=6256 RepID=A0A914R4A1_PAREQ
MRCCIDEQGRLINAPGFNGLDRFEARSKIESTMHEAFVDSIRRVDDEGLIY